MDPDENLRQQRDRVRRINSLNDAAAGHENGEWTPGETKRLAYFACELAELVEALDKWITSGAFVPVAWEPPVRTTVPIVTVS